MANDTFEDLIRSIHDSITSVRKGNLVTKGTLRGYFVPEGAMNGIDEKLDAAGSLVRTDEQSDALDLMHAECTKLREQHTAALAAVAESKQEVVSLKNKLRLASTAKERALTNCNLAWERIEKSRNKFKADLEAAKADREKLIRAGKAPASKFDPEHAVQTDQELKAVTEKLKTTQAELEKLNVEQKNNTAHKEATSREVVQLKKQLAEAESQMYALKAATLAPLDMEIVEKPIVEINMPLMKSILGERGISFLQSAAMIQREDVKDRAMKLMLAAKANKGNVTINGLYKLLELVFAWCKRQTFKARVIIAEWLEEVEHDLRTGTLHALQYYREKLEAIVGELKKKRKAISDYVDEKLEEHKATTGAFFSFVDEVKAWAKTVRNRLQRRALKVAKGFKSAWSKLKTWLTAEPHFTDDYDEKLFDQEEEEELAEPIKLHPPINEGEGMSGPSTRP